MKSTVCPDVLQLTRKQEPEVSSHVLRDALQHQLFGLLRTVHTHSLTKLGKVILPSLLLQKLFSLKIFKREDETLIESKKNLKNSITLQYKLSA